MKYKIPAAATVIILAASLPVCSQEMEPLHIRYPKPMYIGTPKDMEVENLEKTWELPVIPFFVPEGTVNEAHGKLVECSDGEPLAGDPGLVTDGDKEAVDDAVLELNEGSQYITIDLEQPTTIYAVTMWHYHKKARVYFDVVVQVANDPDFITRVTTLFNNDFDNSLGLGVGADLHYIETYEGRLVDGRGTIARYVRLYTNGNTDNDLNHYIEVEVYGKPVP
jgi:hypothetical protein